MGYSHDRKGYRLLDLETLEVIYSHSLFFYEDEFARVPIIAEAKQNLVLRNVRRNECRTRSTLEGHESESELIDDVYDQMGQGCKIHWCAQSGIC